MIVTLTLNPAIDRIISVDHLAFEDRAYINSSRESAGGRGINGSSVIHSFGGQTLAVLTSGGAPGKRLEGHLKDCGFEIQVVPIKNESRTNLTITDQQGLTVNLNEQGPMVDKAELTRVEVAVRERLKGATWLMVCGSLPPGVPADFYAKLITLARKKKVKTLLHTGGDALAEGVEAKPTVVTPNQREAERLLGRTLLTRSHYFDAAARIRAMGPETVVLSLASRGAVAAFAGGVFEALPPRIDAVCAIGAGDALAAGYVWRIRQKDGSNEKALRWAVAAGTASARLAGVTFANFAQTREMQDRVEVKRAE